MKYSSEFKELSRLFREKKKEQIANKINDLKSKIDYQTEDYAELFIMELTYIFMFEGNFKLLLSRINEEEKHILKVANKLQKIRLYGNKGIVLAKLGHFKDALVSYHDGLSICTKELVTEKISLLTNIGVTHNRKKDYILALKYFSEAYDLYKNSESDIKLTSLLTNIGVLYLNLEMYPNAITYLEMCLDTLSETRDFTKNHIYINLIIAHSLNKDFKKADYYRHLTETDSSSYSKAYEIQLHKAMAIYYYSKRELTNSINEYKLIESKVDERRDSSDKIQSCLATSKNYLELNDLEKCKYYIDKIDQIGNVEKYDNLYFDYLKLCRDYYEQIGDIQSAYVYSKDLDNANSLKYKNLKINILNHTMINLHSGKYNFSRDAYNEKINELKNINNELKEQKKLLLESLNDLSYESEIREKFISIISHDVRAPIGNIIQILEMLDEYDDIEEREEILEEVIHSMKQTYSLTNELVNWAKEVIDNNIISQEYINMKALVDEIFELYNMQIKSKAIICENNINSDLELFAHRTSIQTCFRNIIQNAIKYSLVKSSITVSNTISEQKIIFFIKDTGKGMEEEQLTGLFETSRLSTLGTNQELGIGIGLLLVKELVVKNNGTISCESSLGKGTTFTLTFPLHQ